MRVVDRGAQAEVITEQAVLSALATIRDPDLRRDIVSLGFVKGLRIDGGTVAFAGVVSSIAPARCATR